MLIADTPRNTHHTLTYTQQAPEGESETDHTCALAVRPFAACCGLLQPLQPLRPLRHLRYEL